MTGIVDVLRSDALMKREYIINLSRRPRVFHVRVDGRTHESCNVDQLKRTAIETERPQDVLPCARCGRD